ncbi:MAG: hypothetical protein IJY57_00840 [Clostridia bacterium]|nr:hypothetical protein [Clostridia bacterium]
MDNRITKPRLSNFLAYEWLLILLTFALAILGWEVLFTVGKVKLTEGQAFYYYYDMNVSANDDGFRNYLGDTFSYDILEVRGEKIPSESIDVDVLTVKYSAKKLDAVFANGSLNEPDENGYRASRANTIVDAYEVLDFHSLYEMACDYLKGFLKTGESDYLIFSNLDTEKIEQCFYSRNGKDNRYRAGQISAKNELERIEKLCLEVKDFKKILEFDETLSAENSIFYRYTKYEQAYKTSYFEKDRENYKEEYDLQTEKCYGLKLDKLPNTSTSEFFRIGSNTDSKDIVLMAVEFLGENKDLQFESIAFINTVVRSFSSVL